MFEYYFKLIWGWGIQKWPSFFKILLFLQFFAFFQSLKKRQICIPSITIEIYFLQPM